MLKFSYVCMHFCRCVGWDVHLFFSLLALYTQVGWEASKREDCADTAWFQSSIVALVHRQRSLHTLLSEWFSSRPPCFACGLCTSWFGHRLLSSKGTQHQGTDASGCGSDIVDFQRTFSCRCSAQVPVGDAVEDGGKPRRRRTAGLGFFFNDKIPLGTIACCWCGSEGGRWVHATHAWEVRSDDFSALTVRGCGRRVAFLECQSFFASSPGYRGCCLWELRFTEPRDEVAVCGSSQMRQTSLFTSRYQPRLSAAHIFHSVGERGWCFAERAQRQDRQEWIDGNRVGSGRDPRLVEQPRENRWRAPHCTPQSSFQCS